MIHAQNKCLILVNKMLSSDYANSGAKNPIMDTELAVTAELFNGRILVADRNFKIVKDVYKRQSQGRYEGHTVEAGEGSITVDGKTITIYAKANAAELPWGELGVDVVLECTGFYTSKAKAQAHIDAGAKKVVISAPAGNDLPTIVYNVNHNVLTKEDNIISAASCTTNCLAPMAKALNDYAPIQSGIMSTIHAYTGCLLYTSRCV